MTFDPSHTWLPLSGPSINDGDDSIIGPPEDESLRPSYAELRLEHRFAHGLADWMLRNRLTARELAML
jgi:hypothetical protein